MASSASARNITDEEWSTHRNRIVELFQSNSVKKLRSLMKSERGFDATEAQYELRLRDWNTRKYLTKGEWRFLIRIIDLCQAQSTKARVLLSGSPLPPARVKRARRECKKATSSRQNEASFGFLAEVSVEIERQDGTWSPIERSDNDHVFTRLQRATRQAARGYTQSTWSSASDTDGDDRVRAEILNNHNSSDDDMNRFAANSAAIREALESGQQLIQTMSNETFQEHDGGLSSSVGQNDTNTVTTGPLIQQQPQQQIVEPNHSPGIPRIPTPTFSDMLRGIIESLPSRRHLLGLRLSCTSSLSHGWLGQRNSSSIELPAIIPWKQVRAGLTATPSTISASVSAAPYPSTHDGTPDENWSSEIVSAYVIRHVRGLLPRAQSPPPRRRHRREGEEGTVISEDDMITTEAFRLLLLSMANGIYGLETMSPGCVLRYLRKHGGGDTDAIWRNILQLPVHVAKSITTNLLRAAIEDEDHEVLRLLLKIGPIPATDIVCFNYGNRYTGLERAVQLMNYQMVQILLDAGAQSTLLQDIARDNTPYDYEGNESRPPQMRDGDEIWSLIGWGSGLHRSPDLKLEHPGLEHVALWLLSEGAIPRVALLRDIILQNPAVAIRMMLEWPPKKHGVLFDQMGRLNGKTVDLSRPMDWPSALSTIVSQGFSESTVLRIIRRTLASCGEVDCGDCAEDYMQSMNTIVITAADKGYGSVIELFASKTKELTLHWGLVFSTALYRHRREVGSSLRTFPNGPYWLLDYLKEHEKLNLMAEALRREDKEVIHLILQRGDLHNLTDPEPRREILEAAAYSGDVQYVRWLLLRYPSTNLADRETDLGTALRTAASCGDVQYAREILGREDPAVHNDDMQKAMLKAIQNDYDDLYWLLFDFGVDCWSIGSQLLREAIRRRNAPVVLSILRSWAGLEHFVSDECILEAIWWGDRDIILAAKRLSPFSPIRYWATSAKEGATHHIHSICTAEYLEFLIRHEIVGEEWLKGLLCYGVEKGHDKLVRDLISFDVQEPLLLRNALLHSQYDVFDLLVEELTLGAWRTAQAVTIALVLCLDIGYNTREAVDKLLSRCQTLMGLKWLNRYTANQNKRHTNTPLCNAMHNFWDDQGTETMIVGKLFDLGCHPTDIVESLFDDSPRFTTAFMEAISLENLRLVDLMIKHAREKGDVDAVINQEATMGLTRTPLQRAVEINSMELVDLLLDNGANVNAAAAHKAGATALQLAALVGNCVVAAKLLEHGAVLTLPAAKILGRLPLEGAAEFGRTDMIDFLYLSGYPFEKPECARALKQATIAGHWGCVHRIEEIVKEHDEWERRQLPSSEGMATVATGCDPFAEQTITV